MHVRTVASIQPRTRTRAVVDVVFVFALTLLLTVVVGRSPLGAWERGVTNRFFLEYAVMIAVPLLLLAARGRNPADYGIHMRHPRYQLGVAATAFILVAVSSMPLAYFDYKRWAGALVMAVVQVALLFALARLLRLKPGYDEKGVLLGAGLVGLVSAASAQATAGNALSAVVFYLFFLGLGEEILFRGYIQSRLNEAFGRPFRFFGVRWGWGIVITAALFGVMHWLNAGSLIVGNWQPTPWWGFWTFFGALALGFVREKTGSIAAPAILHGLPQAIFAAFTGA